MERHFLVVEDDTGLARALVRLVSAKQRSTGVSLGVVNVAGTVKQGIEALASRRWAGLVIDVGLPDGNGLDVLERARRDGTETPALVLTAWRDRATINRARQLGSRYLAKPADPPEILSFFHDAVSL